jgi:hypothetical protein
VRPAQLVGLGAVTFAVVLVVAVVAAAVVGL